MNVDEARGKLLRISTPMTVDQQIIGESQSQLRASLRQIISDHAEVPLNVSRGVLQLLDDCVDSHMPGTRDSYLMLLAQALRDTLDSVSFLVAEGLFEAAWFRTSDSVSMMGLFLDGLSLEALKPLAAQA